MDGGHDNGRQGAFLVYADTDRCFGFISADADARNGVLVGVRLAIGLCDNPKHSGGCNPERKLAEILVSYYGRAFYHLGYRHY